MTSPPSVQDFPEARVEARIYVAYHDARPVLGGRHLVPIQVGRALTGVLLPGVAGDDTGDNLSRLNPEYCELTAHYWAWRNDPADAPMGLMHYRRLFDLGGRHPARSHPERHVARFDAAAWARDVDRHVAGAGRSDLVVPRPIRLRRSLARQYGRCHDPSHLRALRAVAAERRPDFAPALDRVLGGNRLLLGNMFIMPRPVFDHYSALLFPILAETRARIAAAGPGSGYQARYPGFLAERILTAYVLGGHARAAFPDLRVVHKTVLNIDATGPAAAGWPHLLRLCLERRIGLGDAWTLGTGRSRNRIVR